MCLVWIEILAKDLMLKHYHSMGHLALGQCLVWNFTCIDTFPASYVIQTKEDEGANKIMLK